VSSQQIIDFDKWCLEKTKQTGLPKQMMCSLAIDHFKEFSSDFIRKHTDGIYKQKYRQSNAKKRDYNISKIKKLKSSLVSFIFSSTPTKIHV